MGVQGAQSANGRLSWAGVSRVGRCDCGMPVVLSALVAEALPVLGRVVERCTGVRPGPGEGVACARCAPGHTARAVERAQLEERWAMHAITQLAAGRIRPEDVPDFARRGHGASYAEAVRAWSARERNRKR